MSEHRSLARLPLVIFDGLQQNGGEDLEVLAADQLRREIVSKLKTAVRVRSNSNNNHHQQQKQNPNQNPNPNLQNQQQFESISTVGALLRLPPTVLLRALDPLFTYKECQELHRRICLHCAPKPSTALQLLKNTDEKLRHLPTGLASLDKHLRGGIRVGTITEVVGCAGTAKTQMALQLAVKALAHDQGTIFIDTEKKVSIARLSEIASAHGQQKALEHVTVHAPTNWDELQKVLGTLEDEILTRTSVRLLVIDSIAAPARREFGSSMTQAAAVLQTAQTVKRLAHEFQLAVLIINQVGQTGAALGTAWHHCVSSRIQLEQQHQQQQHHQKDSKRTFTILKSNIVGPSEPMEFLVTDQGLVEPQSLSGNEM